MNELRSEHSKLIKKVNRYMTQLKESRSIYDRNIQCLRDEINHWPLNLYVKILGYYIIDISSRKITDAEEWSRENAFIRIFAPWRSATRAIGLKV